MSSKVTIIVYHYVRDLQNSRYPEIKGLDVKKFQGQLEHLLKHYTPVTMEQVIDALETGRELPRAAFLLTFDDGYLDCYTNVFPLLNAKGVQGSFYPPVQAVTEHKVLDANKIHFVLASRTDHGAVMEGIVQQVDALREEYGLESREHYMKACYQPTRWDGPETGFVKRMLQNVLPLEARQRILDSLFRHFVGVEEGVLARELYLTRDQIRCMHKNGMHFGCHGYSHGWMNFMDRQQQEREVRAGVEFLEASGVDTRCWTMCYPFGGRNESLVNVVKEQGCRLGLILEGRIADLDADSRFELPRIDTNVLPASPDAAPDQWLRQAVA